MAARSRSIGWALAAGVVLAAPPAAAERRTGLGGSFGGSFAWMPYVPTLAVPATSTPVRTVEGGTLPSVGSLFFIGATGDSSFVYKDRLVIPLVGASAAFATGASSEVVTSLDGSIADVRPWTAYRFECLLPGVGVRFTRRRWTFEATARAYVVGVGMSASVATGGGSSDLSWPLRVGLAARADLEVCRRLDPVDRVCAFVAPALYEFGPFDGGSAGLRWEIGP